MSFMGMKLLSHPMKLFLLTFYKYTITSAKLNAHKTLMKLHCSYYVLDSTVELGCTAGVIYKGQLVVNLVG